MEFSGYRVEGQEIMFGFLIFNFVMFDFVMSCLSDQEIAKQV